MDAYWAAFSWLAESEVDAHFTNWQDWSYIFKNKKWWCNKWLTEAGVYVVLSVSKTSLALEEEKKGLYWQ